MYSNERTAVYSNDEKSVHQDHDKENDQSSYLSVPVIRSAACQQKGDAKSETLSDSKVNRRSPKRFRQIDDELSLSNVLVNSSYPNLTHKRRCVMNPSYTNDVHSPIARRGYSSKADQALLQRMDHKKKLASIIREVGNILRYITVERGCLVPKLPECFSIVSRNSRNFEPSDDTGKIHLVEAQVAYLIAKMLPVDHARMVTHSHLSDLHNSCWDLGSSHERTRRMDFQIDPKSATRRTLVKWMSDVSSKMQWTIPSCYGAIAALDAYVILAKHRITLANLPKIAATCLYYSSQMQETAVDESIIPIERFLSICPEVGTSHEFMDHQVHLVDTLQGVNYSRKTPFDLLLLYLARFQVSAGHTGTSLFKIILFRGYLPTIMEMMHIANLAFYYSAGVNQWISPPVWVYCGLYHILTDLLTADQSTLDICFSMCKMALSTISSLNPSDRTRLMMNLIKTALDDATHLACSEDMLSYASSFNQLNQMSSCTMNSTYQAHLAEACKITESLFLKCSSFVNSSENRTKNGRKTVQVPSSSIMELKLMRSKSDSQVLQPHCKGKKEIVTDIPIDCLRPQVLWIHHHPDYIFAELEQTYRKEAQQVILTCSENPLILMTPHSILSDVASQSEEEFIDCGNFKRRGSVCSGMDDVPNNHGRASIEAPLKGISRNC